MFDLQIASTQLMFSTVMVAAVMSSGEEKTGTAFFFSFKLDEQRQVPVLVTNKHVVAGSRKKRCQEPFSLECLLDRICAARKVPDTFLLFREEWAMNNSRMIDAKVAKNFVVIAYVAAVACGSLTLIAVFTGLYGLNNWNLLDVALWYGLAYGVYRRSRTCAIIVFAYHLVNRVDMWNRTHEISTALGISAIALIVIFFLGILGTFAYHAIRAEGTTT